MGLFSGVKSWGRFVFYKGSGIESAKQNVGASFGRMGAALNEAKAMISSTRKAATGKGDDSGQFVRPAEMQGDARMDWLRISSAELGVWALGGLFIIGYLFIVNFSLLGILALTAIILRAALVGSNIQTVLKTFEQRPSFKEILMRPKSVESDSE